MKKALVIILVGLAALFCIPSCNGESEGLLGDLDGDGHLTSSDIALMEDLIEQGSNDKEGDLNNDGQVDSNDLDELKDGVCESNGAQRNAQGNCCYQQNDNTVCCDTNYDGDFNQCTPPVQSCTDNAACENIDCPAFCNQAGECECQNVCADDSDCMPLNCPAYCNANNECECKVPCESNDDCAFLSKCQAQCNNAGFCECSTDECAGEGERIFGPLEANQLRCCEGLEPVECLQYPNNQGNNTCIPWDGEICHICVACGDGDCGTGENPCNCPADCAPDCRQNNSCSEGYVCDPETGDCVVDCRMVNCGPDQNCIVCGEGEICDMETGLCVPDTTCIGEGGTFESFQNENPCCAGLVPVPDHFPENGTCVGPNCPCFICTKCGTDDGSCSLGENRCNCPEDCVTAHNCTANECIDGVGHDYWLVESSCPLDNMPVLPSGPHAITQDGCSLGFEGVVADLVGDRGCMDHDIIFTLKGCQGHVTAHGVSRTIYFICPWSNSNNTQETCTIFLDDMID